MTNHQLPHREGGESLREQEPAPGGCLPPNPSLLPFNRLREVLLHIAYYATEPQARLAEDCGISRPTMSRLIRGTSIPSEQLVQAIIASLSHHHGLPIEQAEVFSTDGTYPTASTCELMDCLGCLPPEAWNEQTDRLKPRWRSAQPGEWARKPQRFTVENPGSGPASKQGPAPEQSL